MEVREGAPSAALQALLAELGSQQERLLQLSADIGSTLTAAAAEIAAESALPQALQASLLERPFVDGFSRPDKPLAAEGDKDPAPFKGEKHSGGSGGGGGSGPRAGHHRQQGAGQHGVAQHERRHSAGGGSVGSGQQVPEGVTTGVHPSALELLEESAERPARCTYHGLQSSKSFVSSKSRLSLSKEDAELEDEDEAEGANGSPARAARSRISQQRIEEELLLVRRNAVFRLQARLGKKKLQGYLTAKEVYRSITSLGMVKYTLSDLERWLQRLNEWHCERDDGIYNQLSSFSHTLLKLKHSHRTSATSDMWEEEHLAYNPRAIPMRVFVELLLDDEKLATLETEYQEMCLTIREVLFSGDANRLVAELTNVCVDDVAAPNEKPDLLTMMEPVIGCIIILNGIFIGMQSSRAETGGHDEWFWTNVGFTVFFTAEMVIRTHLLGCHELLRGPERFWNIFDCLLIVISLCDVTIEAASLNSGVGLLSVMRILRLMRLSRLVRIFRLRYMKELTLMVRGLVGGLKTLFWAVVLLFFTIYIVACVVSSTIGRSTDPVPEIAREDLVSTVPSAFFTSFRCLMGDCNTSEGKPIVKLLADKYGMTFQLGYGATMMFVVFGLFNLIIAIYIENTLSAAKTEGEKNKAQRHRESVRIARLTRQLLKKFCALQRLWAETHNGEATEVKKIISLATFTDIGGISMPVSKEMFLCLIQDPSVQKLMDDLDIPSERASLFDILDADGSGDLEVVELITGLLRVRGEAKKSDAVGTLLAVRVVQEMLREHKDRFEDLDDRLGSFLTAQSRQMRCNRDSLVPVAHLRRSRWNQQLMINGLGSLEDEDAASLTSDGFAK